MSNSQSRADPYFYYNWSHDGLMVWLTWIDDNLLLGNKNGVEVQWKKILKNLIAQRVR